MHRYSFTLHVRHKLRLIEENFPKPREKRIFGGEKNGGGVNTHLLCDIPRRDEGKGGGGRYAGTRGGPDLGARTGASPVSMGTGTLTWKTISRGVSHRRHSGIDLFDHLAWLNGACPPFTAFSFNENNHRGSWPPNPQTPPPPRLDI